MKLALPVMLGDRNDSRERYDQSRVARRGIAARLLAPVATVSASPKTRRRERSARKNRTGRALQPNESSTRSIRCATARNPAGSRQFQQECECRCTTNEDVAGLLRLRQVCCDLRLLKVGQASSLPSADERKLEARATSETSAKLDLLDELLEEAIDGNTASRLQPVGLDAHLIPRTPSKKVEIPILLSRRFNQTA